MPPKTRFTRETVVEAGLSQLSEGGWEALTPKGVARRLGASTMPLFTHFPTMEIFREAVLDRAWQLLVEYASRCYTGDTWVDQGIGYVLFARDHGRLFSCMHYGPPARVQERRYRFWVSLSDAVKKHPDFTGVSPEVVGHIRHIRSLLVHGIAVSVSSGLTDLWEKDDLVKQMITLCSEVLCTGLSERKDRVAAILHLIPPDARKRIGDPPAD